MNLQIKQQSPDPALLQGRVPVCMLNDLVAHSGVCALLGNEQIAVFWIPGLEPEYFGIGNFDPVGGANVLSRGITGTIGGEPVVASPLYKQHYSLRDGRCLEQDNVSVPVYQLLATDGMLYCNTLP